jgi:hypothetical protein
MSAFSLDLSPPVVTRRVRRRGWLARVIAAVEDSRMRSARAALARHRHLLPGELERAGDRLDARSEDRLPFGRHD